ncbi:MAG: DUF748 domain-containing protein [Steroidobacterales bacterium]
MVASAFESSSRWIRTHWRALAGLAAALLLYALAGFVLVPRLARNAIESYVRTDLGRRISIGSLRFNPFTFTAEVRAVALAEADGAPIAGFEALRVNAALSSLLYRAWTFKEVRLDRPDLNVIVSADGGLNLAALRPARRGQTASPSSDLPPVRIGAFSVHQGRLRLEDRTRSPAFVETVAPIEFSLADFRTSPKHENRYQFSGATLAGERFSWSGEFSLQPFGSSGAFTLAGFKAATIAGYLREDIPMTVARGTLGLQGSYNAVIGDTTQVTLRLSKLTLEDLALASREPGAAAPWLSVLQIGITDAAVTLPERQLTVAKIDVTGAKLAAWRERTGELSVSQLFASGSAGEDSGAGAASTAGAKPWGIRIGAAELRDGEVDLEDRSVQPAAKFALTPIALRVNDFSSIPGSAMKIELTCGLGGKGSFSAHGTVGLQPLNTTMALAIKDIELSLLQPYVAQSNAMQINRGRLAATMTLSYEAQATRAARSARNGPQLAISGAAEIADLLIRDDELNSDLVSWQSLKVQGLRYRLEPAALHIDQIVMRHPFGRLILAADGTLNIAAALKPPKGAAASSPPATVQTTTAAPTTTAVHARTATKVAAAAHESAAAVSFPLDIGTIVIQGGAADFTDHTVTPTFSVAMLGLKGTITGLSSRPASRAEIKLEGNVDRYAPVSIAGQFNLLSATTYSDVTMSFRNIDLTTFNPYSGKFAGYAISQGKLSTELHYHVDNRRLQAQHHIVIDQLEFGAATESKQAVPLPIKLAAALLKDRHGVIDIELPVNGSIDDPQFRLGPIIWKAFVGLLTKIVTAPFALLGSLFGGGEELAFVDFPAGSTLLPPEQTRKLTQLATALIERPQLRLDIPLHTASDADDEALAHAALEQALEQSLRSQPVPAQPNAGVKRGRAKSAPNAGASQPPGTSTSPPPSSLRLGALAALYEAKFGEAPTYPESADQGSADLDAARTAWLEQQLLLKFAATRAQREALERARAEAARAAVLANPGLQPERVFLTDRTSGGGPAGAVRMELKLQ